LELTPSSAWTIGYRGAAQYQLGRYDAALADLNRALDLDAFDPWPLYIRGLTKRKAGDQPGADADIAAALAIWPDAASGVAKDGIR
jgi:tetratricopeptide (TPR) repeat protein